VACGRGQTDTQTDTQTRVTTIHFASSTTHAKCNKKASQQTFIDLQSVTDCVSQQFEIGPHQFDNCRCESKLTTSAAYHADDVSRVLYLLIKLAFNLLACKAVTSPTAHRVQKLFRSRLSGKFLPRDAILARSWES